MIYFFKFSGLVMGKVSLAPFKVKGQDQGHEGLSETFYILSLHTDPFI